MSSYGHFHVDDDILEPSYGKISVDVDELAADGENLELDEEQSVRKCTGGNFDRKFVALFVVCKFFACFFQLFGTIFTRNCWRLRRNSVVVGELFSSTFSNLFSGEGRNSQRK